MRLRLSIILGIILLPVISFSQELQCNSIRDIAEKDLSFKDGESLTYVVTYKWGSVMTDVGEGVTTLRRIGGGAQPVHFHASVTGKTYKFYDMFFKVRDLYESKFYASSIRPFYFYRSVEEGKYRMKNTYSFSLDNTIRAKVQKYDNPVTDTVLKGNNCTFDILTLFYYARNLDFTKLQPGDKQPMSFTIDGELYDIYYRFIGREVKKIPGTGTFRTIKFAAKLVAGKVFRGDKEMIIWITEDSNKIPLMFEMEIIIGKVYGRLTKFENLKFPQTSKLK
ncbi:MAG: DUF3108 domain-containing protein [Bacteroidales bacterium]|jgi:hypothetical protein|nr:DUF3108 domain-containing protein [Bacteroidales bacterium]MDD2280220.1 DUF3108 domain-containing protein [Bacteroidales bacterium]MDD4292358.1 DUF3108 domain-containing protein [Bacteroidales bacterium]MDD4491059.1 DUF3108 domain-containing protein [Bacteroidales bacterium]HPS95408.1 DUF3108 domain-containing protein [Bacteroidales bacterium]